MDLETYKKSFAQALNYDADNPDNHPFLIDDLGENRIFIITSNGGVSFNTDVILGHAEIRMEDGVKKRDRIYNVHYNAKNKLVFVACGHDGVDIYQVVDNKLKYATQVTTYQLAIPNGQVIDIDSDGEHNLYVLDKETGLRFYLIYDLDNVSVDHQFTITITNAKSFDHYGSTFFIVARTVNNQDYAVEVFVNLHRKDYFFNSYYIDEMTINDVNVFQYYAVLIGDDGHKIVYHSIYSGFIDSQLMSHTAFQEPDLFKVKEYKYDQQELMNVRQLAGIAKYEFKFFSITMNHPTVDCVLEKPETVQYFVNINSTNCNEKEDKFDHQFTLCKITHLFSLTSTERPGNYHTYAYYTIALYVLFVVVVWVIIFVYICFKKLGNRLSFLSWRKKIADAAAPYNESFDVKEQELPEQQKQQQ